MTERLFQVPIQQKLLDGVINNLGDSLTRARKSEHSGGFYHQFMLSGTEQ